MPSRSALDAARSTSAKGDDSLRLTIRYSTDKNGREIAHYFGRAQRWLPITLYEAQNKIAQGAQVQPRPDPVSPETIAHALGLAQKPR
jgi:hypothetical protein